MDAIKKIWRLSLLWVLLFPAKTQAQVIYVNTATQLQNALNAAQPGQVIHVADGYYERSGGFYAVAGIHGTAANPITVIGSRNAVLSTGNIASGYGFSLKGNDHWIIKGFSVRVCKDGVMIDQSKYVTIDSLDVRRTGNSGIHLRTYTSYSVIRNCFIDSAGLENPSFGEGVYIGSAYSNWCTYTDCEPDTSNYNQVLNNVFGSYIAAENVDIKEGTKGGLIKGNTFNGAGLQNMNGGDSWIDVKGNYYLIDSNTGHNTILDGFQTHIQQPGGYGNYNRFSNNVINMNAAGYGVRVQTSNANGTATANEVCNNNTLSGSSAGLANVALTSCSPLLPLIILDWNIMRKNDNLVFSWKVSGSNDIAFFDVQQSENGSDFMPLMRINHSGDIYSKDTSASAVKGRYFRVAVTLKRGGIVYSKTISISSKAGAFNAAIRNNQLVVMNPGTASMIRIMTITGQTLGLAQLLPGYNYIKLKGSADLYVLNVTGEQQQSAFTKIIGRYGY